MDLLDFVNMVTWGSHLQYSFISAPFRDIWSTWCCKQLLKRVSYLHEVCWCCWNGCSVELVQFFRVPEYTRLKGQTERTPLQDWELQRNSQSYIGFIKLIKVTPRPKWVTALLHLCCGSWNSRVWFPHTTARTHRSKAAATMFAKGNVFPTVCSFCPRRAAATGLPHSDTSLFESEVQVTFPEIRLKTSHFKIKNNKTVKPPRFVLPPPVKRVSPQSPTTLWYNQRGNKKVGLAISSSVRSKAYHAVPLLTLRLHYSSTFRILNKWYIKY